MGAARGHGEIGAGNDPLVQERVGGLHMPPVSATFEIHPRQRFLARELHIVDVLERRDAGGTQIGDPASSIPECRQIRQGTGQVPQ